MATLPELAIEGPPETVLTPATARLAAWAKRNSSDVIFGAKTRRDRLLYNSAVLLDRKGDVVGRYDKIHPTEGELKSGIAPGATDPPVFETDFGIIGIQICFDERFVTRNFHRYFKPKFFGPVICKCVRQSGKI
ncbi:MAG: carbon-nitrogen hydrolase family protein [Bryobacteraceae bacterium]